MVQELNGTIAVMPDVTGSRYLEMAAAKPEVLISQLPDKIATKFQHSGGGDNNEGITIRKAYCMVHRLPDTVTLTNKMLLNFDKI